jgi:ParB family chromosome partitioning protein
MLIKGNHKRDEVTMDKNISYISTDLITPNIYQPRRHFNEETIEELAQSIKA